MNYIAALVAAIAAYMIGWLWYGPLFGKPWRRMMGVSDKDMEKAKGSMGVVLLGGFLATLVMSGVLSLLLSYTGVTGVAWGMAIAGLAWIGFVATILLNSVFYERKPLALWAINASHYLVAMLVMGAILGAWR